MHQVLIIGLSYPADRSARTHLRRLLASHPSKGDRERVRSAQFDNSTRWAAFLEGTERGYGS
jgi:hypothetical protein